MNPKSLQYYILSSTSKHCRSLPLMDRATQKDIYINKVLISVVVFVYISEYNYGTPEPICMNASNINGGNRLSQL